MPANLRVILMVNAIPELLPHTKGGRLRVIGAMTEKRHPFIPDVPTFDESGLKGYEASTWFGLLAPAATPAAVLAKLQQESARVIALPDIRQRIIDNGGEIVGITAAEFAAQIKTEIADKGDLVRAAGAKAN